MALRSTAKRTAIKSKLIQQAGFVLSFAIAAFLTLSASAIGMSLRVDQLVFDVTADPGESVPLSLQVENLAEDPAVVTVYNGDWHRSPTGEHIYLESGTLKRSASPWISIAPTQFQVQPGQQSTVRFTVTLPNEGDLEGTYWSMLFIEPAARPQPGSGTTIKVVQRIGIKIHVTVRGTGTRSGLVEKIEATYSPERQAVEVATHFTNNGMIPLNPNGWVQLVDGTGKAVSRVPIEAFPVLPGDSNIFRILVPTSELPKGRYAVVSALDYGASQMVGGQAQVEIQDGQEGDGS